MSELVLCRSDGDFPGRPLYIQWKGDNRAVISVIAAWRTPQGKYYLVRTQDEAVFQCCYLESKDRWEMEER